MSVVVQGPVLGRPSDPPLSQWTKRALDSARRVLPGAEIILSTWNGSDLTGLVADRILENEDPGATTYFGTERPNNVNRQIVSTRNGVTAASRPFVLKLRSETVVHHDGFRRYFGRYPARCASQAVQHRVVASTIGSCVPREVDTHTCYRPSDWFHFGTREDVLALWDVPLAPEPETSHWFATMPFPDGLPAHPAKLRYCIEQYVWVAFLRKYHPVDFDSLWDVRDETIAASERSLAANLVLISPDQAGLQSLKYPLSAFGSTGHIRRGFYTHAHWRVLYERYCAGRHLHAASWYPPFFRMVRASSEIYRQLKRVVSG